MRRRLRFAAVLLLQALPLYAQLPEAPIEATIKVNQTTPFIKETVLVTLTIITRDIDIRQQLDVADLPPPERLAFISKFNPLPVKRKIDGPHRIETRRYQAKARALAAGSISIAPTLRLTTQRRVRSFFGSAIEERPVRIRIAPVTLEANPLPPPPQDFCGAIGKLNVEITATPTNLVAGDLLTVTTRITGEGYLENLTIPSVKETTSLKVYPVKELQATPQERRFAQTVIPTSETIHAIPELSLSVFDTEAGHYVSHTAGPFPLNYQRPSTRVIEQFKPKTARTTSNQATNTVSSWRQRLADGRTVSFHCATETTARLAPSLRSRVTFTIPPDSTVQVHDRHGDWLLVEHRRARGWIHQETLTPSE